jgi:hypothetical protein
MEAELNFMLFLEKIQKSRAKGGLLILSHAIFKDITMWGFRYSEALVKALLSIKAVLPCFSHTGYYKDSAKGSKLGFVPAHTQLGRLSRLHAKA